MKTQWTKAALSVLERRSNPGLVPRAIIDPDFERELDELRKGLAAESGGGTGREARLSGLFLCNGRLGKNHLLSQGRPAAAGPPGAMAWVFSSFP